MFSDTYYKNDYNTYYDTVTFFNIISCNIKQFLLKFLYGLITDISFQNVLLRFDVWIYVIFKKQKVLENDHAKTSCKYTALNIFFCIVNKMIHISFSKEEGLA